MSIADHTVHMLVVLHNTIMISIQQPELVQVIQKHLIPGGMLFMQGDIIEVLQSFH
jgi:hypothetical protein